MKGFLGRIIIILLSVFLFMIFYSKSIIFTESKTNDPILYEIQQCIQIGNGIITQLYQFQKKEGFFPSSLSELVPDYMHEIPIGPNGQKFYYESTRTNFLLVAWLRKTYRGSCAFEKRLGDWDCGLNVEE